MRELPTGTVTFLLTDVEGSTRLWEQHPRAMRVALARHDALIERHIGRHSGLLVRPRGEGDSRFAVFRRASDAVAASCAIQLALVRGRWALPQPLRVRIALYTGETEVRDGDYYGTAVNRCARLRALAYGGQTLVAGLTAGLVHDHLPAGASLRALGTYQLKDVSEREEIFQLVHAGLAADFPPLPSAHGAESSSAHAAAAVADNATLVRPPLPLQLTSFVGRAHELAEVTRLLGTARLLTLTGAGGIGKTRLALEVAAEVQQGYADGVALVELAPLADPALVRHAVAAAVGIREQSQRPIIERLVEALGQRELLLVLDNCEHLIQACADLANQLLRSCAHLSILATSREALGIEGETAWRVPSLSVPESNVCARAEQVAQSEAVSLFVQRAAAALPVFALADRNAPAIAQLCGRLDGIPLAIELAAARVTMLSVEQIAERLSDALRLLNLGRRTAPARQQTLQATLAWSYELLTDPERRLFERLSVFAGGWTLEAAEAVCVGDGIEADIVLDLLGRLEAKSLLLAEPDRDGEYRYRLLETLRQYAGERLHETGQTARLRGRHLEWCLALAEAALPALSGTEQHVWLARLECEHDNLRAALAWSLQEPADAEPALRLAGALHMFWWRRAYLAEGRMWLAEALQRDARVITPLSRRGKQARALALKGSGVLARQLSDYAAADSLFTASLALARELGDPAVLADSLFRLAANLVHTGDDARASALAKESLALWHRLDHPRGLPLAVRTLATLAWRQGDYERATALYQEFLGHAQDAGDAWEIARVYCNLGILAYEQGQFERAGQLLEASRAGFQELGFSEGTAWVGGHLARAARARGETTQAKQQFGESLRLFTQLGSIWGIAECLLGLAGLEAEAGRPQRAAQLLGSVDALREAHGLRLPRRDAERQDQEVAGVRAALGQARFDAAWHAGHRQAVNEAVAAALATVPNSLVAATRSP